MTQSACFPDSKRESWLVGLLCDLVFVKPEQRQKIYLNAVMVPSHPISVVAAVEGEEQLRLAQLLLACPKYARKDQELPWLDMLSLLTKRHALIERVVNGKMTMDVGHEFAAVRPSYPEIDPALPAALISAAEKFDVISSEQSRRYLAAKAALGITQSDS